MNKYTILKRSKQVCLFSLGVPFTLLYGMVVSIIFYVPFVCYLFYSGFVLNENPFKQILELLKLLPGEIFSCISDTKEYNEKNKLLHHFYTIFSLFIALPIIPVFPFLVTYLLYDEIRRDTLLETIRDNLPSFRKKNKPYTDFDYKKSRPSYIITICNILDFGKEENPSHHEIKKKYHSFAFQYHPDKQPQGISEEERTKREEKFKETTAAYSSYCSWHDFFAAPTTFEEEEEKAAASQNYCSVD